MTEHFWRKIIQPCYYIADHKPQKDMSNCQVILLNSSSKFTFPLLSWLWLLFLSHTSQAEQIQSGESHFIFSAPVLEPSDIHTHTLCLNSCYYGRHGLAPFPAFTPALCPVCCTLFLLRNALSCIIRFPCHRILSTAIQTPLFSPNLGNISFQHYE